MPTLAHAIVIGAGSTGSALAHDLTLRGLRVTVLDRAGVASGSTGHNQAQLHSGARYAVNDPEPARECIRENWILRHIQPEALELNDGLFVAIDDEGMTYRKTFLEACEACNIPVRELTVEDALRMEPLLNPHILSAIQIPDGVFDPYRLCLSYLATACQHGAKVRTFCDVKDLDIPNRNVKFHSRITNKTESLSGDVIINVAGPWAAFVGALGGLHVDLEPSAGAMVTIDRRVCNMVVNLLAPPGDGDIIVPQRQTSILGTTSWKVEDPDHIPVTQEHIEIIYKVAETMIPAIRQSHPRGVMAAARPLMLVDGAGGRTTTRGFICIDHSSAGASGFFSVVGGKTTTARLMAEKVADKVCAFLGIEASCRTQDFPLLSYRKWVQA
jgi:glycerol-3-phosphate dehydrogenase